MATPVATPVDARPTTRVGYWSISCFAFVVTAAFAGIATLGTSPGELPRVWLVATVAFSWLTMSWRGGALPRPDRYLGLTLLVLALIGAGTGIAMGAPVGDVARSALGIPLQAAVMAAVTQWCRSRIGAQPHPPVRGASQWRNDWAVEWIPTSGRDLLALAFAALVSGAVGIAAGAVPGVHLATLTPETGSQWLAHMLAISTVGGACTLILFGSWSPRDLKQPWVRVTLVWLASVGLLAGVHLTEAVTMAWLQVVPSIFIAMTCRVWVTALFGLLLGLISVLLSPRLNEITAYPGPIPLGTVMDLLVAGTILISLMLGFLDRRRDHLVHDLDRERARTANHLQVMQNVFEGMHDGVVVVGADLALQFHNSAAIDLLGRPFPVVRPDDWARHFGLTALDGTPLSTRELEDVGHVVVPLPEGRRVLSLRVLDLEDIENATVMTVLSDVTEQHDRIHELSGFAGVVAHDLRAPLTSLEGWLELAEEALRADSPDPEAAATMLTRARASNGRMRQLIDDWLDYTVDRQGELAMAPFPLTVPVNAVMATLAESGPHRFSIEVPHHVRADIATVRQVLANVLGNASKFSRPGETPRISVRSSVVDGGWVQVEVEDHGIGIPPGQEETIFEEYRRGSGEATRVDGFGLGLALCRRIVERHGGRIAARNNEHGGATVTFTLPAAERQVPELPRHRSVRR